MEATPLDPGFFTSFAWATFAQFREVGIGLVVTLTLIALLVELISVHQGGGMEAGGILVRAATAIVLLSCFRSVIEGAKDFVWSIEKVISSAGSIEQTLDRFSQLAESGPFWTGHMGRIQLMFAGWGLTLAHYFSDFIFWLYGVLWLCATISAPILIPTLVMEATQKIFRLFLFFVLALLFARIPWAMVSAVLGHLVEYLSTHGKGEELRAFFLFWIALVVTAVTPLVSTIAFFKMDGVVRAATQTMKLVGQAAGGALNAGATVAGRAAWGAQQYVHVMHGKEMMTGDMAKAFESRFGSYRKPPTLGQAELESAEKRSRDYYKPKPT